MEIEQTSKINDPVWNNNDWLFKRAFRTMSDLVSPYQSLSEVQWKDEWTKLFWKFWLPFQNWIEVDFNGLFQNAFPTTIQGTDNTPIHFMVFVLHPKHHNHPRFKTHVFHRLDSTFQNINRTNIKAWENRKFGSVSPRLEFLDFKNVMTIVDQFYFCMWMLAMQRMQDSITVDEVLTVWKNESQSIQKLFPSFLKWAYYGLSHTFSTPVQSPMLSPLIGLPLSKYPETKDVRVHLYTSDHWIHVLRLLISRANDQVCFIPDQYDESINDNKGNDFSYILDGHIIQNQRVVAYLKRKLSECKQRYVMIRFIYKYFTAQSSHINVIWIDQEKKEYMWYEPQGTPNIHIETFIKTIWEPTILSPGYTRVGHHEVCPNLTGLQSIHIDFVEKENAQRETMFSSEERKQDVIINPKSSGYCVAWATALMSLVILNPGRSLKEIHEFMYRGCVSALDVTLFEDGLRIEHFILSFVEGMKCCIMDNPSAFDLERDLEVYQFYYLKTFEHSITFWILNPAETHYYHNGKRLEFDSTKSVAVIAYQKNGKQRQVMSRLHVINVTNLIGKVIQATILGKNQFPFIQFKFLTAKEIDDMILYDKSQGTVSEGLYDQKVDFDKLISENDKIIDQLHWYEYRLEKIIQLQNKQRDPNCSAARAWSRSLIKMNL